MTLSLKLLGEFALRDASGAELSLPTRKTRALLGYLAVNADRPQPRERLMALLWSDRGERQARQSLNQALLSIRKLADGEGAALLDSDGERVTLRSEAVESDVGQLRSVVRNNPAEAATIYEGPFLDGLSAADPGFEEWLLATRSELHSLACDALDAATKGGDLAAIDCAKRLVTLDPLREDAHRRLMELLHRSGDRAGALRQYQACAEVLKRELEVEPDAATKALFEKIRQETQPDTRLDSSPVTPARPAPTDEPAIAVLPLEVIGSNPQTNDLADGLVEDLITALAKVRDLLVIDRHSTEIYRGQTVNVREVAGTLGVRYVLTGSIRTLGDRLRCSVQLVDAVSGRHLWTERYDRTIDDIFALQDEIVRHVLIEMQVNLTRGEHARIAARGTNNFDAWMLCIQGEAQLHGFTTQENIVRARELLESAHQADPRWARPIAGIAGCHYYEARFGWSLSPNESIAHGIEHAERAIKTDPGDPLGYLALRSLNVLLGKHDEALVLCEKALSLAPNDYQTRAVHAVTLLMSGDDPAGAVSALDRAIRLGPIPPPWVRLQQGLALHVAGYIDSAISALEALLEEDVEHLDGHAMLAAAYVSAGRFNDARTTAERLRERDPTYSIARALTRVYFKNRERTEWLRSLFVKAGLPKGAAEPRS